MNNDHSWYRTQEVEIDLLDLLRRLRIQWRKILICGLVAAVFAGGCSFLYSRNRLPETAAPLMQEDAAQTETAAVKVPLTKEEQKQGVEQAKQLQAEIDGLEGYLEDSILMQVDPFHKESRNLLFAIEGTQNWKAQKIAESYLNFLAYGAAGAVKKADHSMEYIDNSYLSELITAIQKTNSTYNAENSGQTLSGILLQVGVTGQDAKMAERLASDIQNVLQDHHIEVKNTCGSHTLTLLDDTAGERVDYTLLTQQREKRALLTTVRTSLKTLVDGFDEEQKALYKIRSDEKDEEEQQPEMEEQGQELSAGQRKTEEQGQELSAGQAETDIQQGSISIIAILFGFLGGMLIYCAGYACWYMLRDTIRSEGEFKDHYTIPFYGSIPVYKENTITSSAQKKKYQQRQTQLLSRIRLSCRKEGISRICLAVDALSETERQDALDTISLQLQELGIDAKLAENISGNPELWNSDLLVQAEAVILVCGLGSTTYRSVDDTMEFCVENGIAVLGAAALDG